MSVVNTYSLGQFRPVSWTITHSFGASKRFPWLLNPGVRLRVGNQQSQVWPILAYFVDYYSLFWGPEVISTIGEPRVRLRVDHQHSQFWPILVRFVDYYSLFWVPERFPQLTIPGVRLRVRRQHSQF